MNAVMPRIFRKSISRVSIALTSRVLPLATKLLIGSTMTTLGLKRSISL